LGMERPAPRVDTPSLLGLRAPTGSDTGNGIGGRPAPTANLAGRPARALLGQQSEVPELFAVGAVDKRSEDRPDPRAGKFVALVLDDALKLGRGPIEMGVEASRETIHPGLERIEPRVHPPNELIEPRIDVIEAGIHPVEPSVGPGGDRIDACTQVEERPE
jgi:hypothetical protein